MSGEATRWTGAIRLSPKRSMMPVAISALTPPVLENRMIEARVTLSRLVVIHDYLPPLWRVQTQLDTFLFNRDFRFGCTWSWSRYIQIGNPGLAHHVRLVARKLTNGLFFAGPGGLGKSKTITDRKFDFRWACVGAPGKGGLRSSLLFYPFSKDKCTCASQ